MQNCLFNAHVEKLEQESIIEKKMKNRLMSFEQWILALVARKKNESGEKRKGEKNGACLSAQ